LIIRKSSKHESGYTINIREDASEAIRIYRDKDVVEKGFLRLKNSLGLGRLRVHSQQAMGSKVFVGFTYSRLTHSPDNAGK